MTNPCLTPKVVARLASSNVSGSLCSEVEQRFLLYLAANSSALDQANGSIGFVGGAAGRCLGYKHSPILAKSKPLWESLNGFCHI